MSTETETSGDLIGCLLDGAIVTAPDGTASAFIEGTTLRICAEQEPSRRDMAWIQHCAGLAAGGCCEPYEPEVDCYLVNIAPNSPLAGRAA